MKNIDGNPQIAVLGQKNNHLRTLQSFDDSTTVNTYPFEIPRPLGILREHCLIRPAIKDQLERNGVPESHSNAVKEFVIQRPIGGAFTDKFPWGDCSEISLKLTNVFDG